MTAPGHGPAGGRGRDSGDLAADPARDPGVDPARDAARDAGTAVDPAGRMTLAHRYLRGGDDEPTLLLLHGTGGDENDLVPLGRALADGAHLLSPRGQVRENGAPRWFRRLAEGVFDTDDLIARAHELADFVDEAIRVYGLDPTRLTAVGFSNGANIAVATMLLRPETIRAGMLLAPMVPLRPARSPDLSHAAVFIGAGRRDPIAAPEGVEELAGLLADSGARVEVHWHQGGHEIRPETVTAAHAWLRKVRAATATDPLP